jgi:hypothetical protein
MKNRLVCAALVAASSLASLLGVAAPAHAVTPTVSATAAHTAPAPNSNFSTAPATASTERTVHRMAVIKFHVDKSSDRGMRVYSGLSGKGDTDWVPDPGWSELAWVGSVSVPARCALYAGALRLQKAKSHQSYHNFLVFVPVGGYSFKCKD